MAAGKDVYLEKPLSNTVERAVEALSAYKSSNRVVQFGTQQRSGSHFQEAAKIVQEGQLGKITHAVIQFPGNGYGTAPGAGGTCPAGTELGSVSGPAPRRPFKPGRLRWRGWWDYGGGLITDWGVHLTDVALWYLDSQRVGPLLTSGTAQYVNFVNPERDQSPDAFSVSWQYPELRDDVHECRGPGLGVRPSGKLLLRSWREPADPSRRLRGAACRGWRRRSRPWRSGGRERAGRTGRDGGADCPGSAAADPTTPRALARERRIRQQQRDDRARPQFPRLREVEEQAGQRAGDWFLRVAALSSRRQGRCGKAVRSEWDDAAKKAVAV